MNKTECLRRTMVKDNLMASLNRSDIKELDNILGGKGGAETDRDISFVGLKKQKTRESRKQRETVVWLAAGQSLR